MGFADAFFAGIAVLVVGCEIAGRARARLVARRPVDPGLAVWAARQAALAKAVGRG